MRNAVAALLLGGVLMCWACAAAGSKQAGKEEKKNDKKGKKEKGEKVIAGSPISGGTFEASAAIQVPGTDKVLFVDDGRPGEVLLMQVDQNGQQVGAARVLATGAHVENPEGITYDGSRFYIVGSQSNPKRGEMNAIARFRFQADGERVSDIEVIKDFRALLLNRVAELKGDAAAKGADGGLNIEGLAWDGQNQRLLFGLRSPIRNRQALVLALKLRDVSAAFTADSFDFAAAQLLPLSLDGQGIRDLQYDERLKAFLVISGAPENQDKGDFVLWQWDGAAASATPARKLALDPGMKPEGITEFRHGEQHFIFVLGDASRYMKLDYESLL